MKNPVVSFILFAAACTGGFTFATETENLNMQVLPAPGKVVIDGKFDDWDLTGGIFACSDVENLRDQFSQWFHVMYDAENLYVLARWKDPTPLNNPGVKGDHGFAGDCLQFRTVTTDAAGKERTAHMTFWKLRVGGNLMDITYGQKLDEGNIPDAKTEGAKQTFAADADGKGYVQEIAVPWKLLTADKQPLKGGARMVMTVEPNFTAGQEAGLPVVNWSGLVQSKEIPGFKPTRFAMPFDGYVSLNLFAPDGTVARRLLTCAFFAKGNHEVKWDGLTTPYWRTPGQPVEPGAYTWKAVAHKGIGLRLRGWASNGGNAYWDSSLTSNWGGDHGVPFSCATDGEKVYLGWTGAEAGKAVVACDLQGNLQWKHTRDGTLARSSFQKYVGPLRQAMREQLERGAESSCQKTAGTCRKLLKQEPSLWTFVWIAGIEPTNNDAERALRHAVLWRKSSGGTDSEAGSRFVERMLSVVATARQQNRNVLELLTACCTARLAGSTAPSLLPTAAARAAA